MPLPLGNPKKVRFASHTTSHITELESVQSSVDILLQHKLPKARQRTNVVTQDYTPRGRLFGGYTTRGEGVTMASYRFPEVISAIHSIAATRPSGFADEPYLSAQLNSAMSLPSSQGQEQSQHDMAHCLRKILPVEGCGLNHLSVHILHLCLGTLLRRSLGANISTPRTLGFALILNCITLSNL